MITDGSNKEERRPNTTLKNEIRGYIFQLLLLSVIHAFTNMVTKHGFVWKLIEGLALPFVVWAYGDFIQRILIISIFYLLSLKKTQTHKKHVLLIHVNMIEILSYF